MKSKFLAATALISMMAIPAAALAQTNIEIGRQTFLDNGSAPQSLNRNETAAVSAAGTHSLTCTREFVGAAPTGTALEDFDALAISNSASASGNANAPVTGSVTLTYNGRINPKGMAVGDAMYQGSFDAATVGAAASPLSCPEGGSRSLGFRAAVQAVEGQEFRAAVEAVAGQEFIATVEGKEAVYGTMPEPVCKAAALADNGGTGGGAVMKVSDCPKVTDYSNIITPAVQAVAGQEYRAAVEAVAGQEYRAAVAGSPEVPAQTVTWRYAPSGASFSQSSLTVTVEGQTFSY